MVPLPCTARKATSALITFLLAGILPLFAQQEMGLHFMDGIMQLDRANPAYLNGSQPWKVGIALPSVVVNLGHTGFRWSDLTEKEGDSLRLTPEQAISRMSEKNYLLSDLMVEWLKVNLVLKDRQSLSIWVADRQHTRMRYARGLFEILWFGNAPYLGEAKDISVTMEALYFREFAIGYSRQLKEGITAGARFKLLQGLLSIHTPRRKATLYTAQDVDTVTLSIDYKIYTSGFGHLFEGVSYPLDEYIFPWVNTGFAVDMGVQVTVVEGWRFAAALNDIGFIRWKKDPYTLTSSGTFTLSGIDLRAYLKGSIDPLTGNLTDTVTLKNFLDTLKNTFAFQESREEYTAWLTSSLSVSAWHSLTNKLQVHGLLHIDFFEGPFPALAVGALYSGRKAGIMGGWAYKNREWINMMLGWWVRIKAVQLYAVGDNILAFVLPQHLRSYNLRAGINILIGTKQKETEAREAQ